MKYGFDTQDDHAATAALLVYAIWRSRDMKRFKVTPDVWSQVERFAKASAKRATTLPRFIESLKPRLLCGTISPRWMEVGIKGAVPMVDTEDGLRIQLSAPDDQREFMTAVIDDADTRRVLDRLYRETAYVVLLVRDRLEREKPIENRFSAAFAAEDEVQPSWM